MYDIKRQKPELSLKEGVFINDIEGYSIKVDKIDKKSGMMYNMLIYNHTDRRGNYEMTIADSGIMEADPTGAVHGGGVVSRLHVHGRGVEVE